MMTHRERLQPLARPRSAENREKPTDTDLMPNPKQPRDGVVACSVVVPVYNSAATLQELYERLAAVLERYGASFEMIFVEDAGTDASWHVLTSLAQLDGRVRAIQLMKNSGQGSATMCGLMRARGSVVVTLDDDLQHPPEEIPRLLAVLDSDPEIDVAIGVPRTKRHSIIRRLGSWLIDRGNSIMLDKPRDLRFTAFRAMRSTVVAELGVQRVIRPALGPMLITVTNRICNIEVDHHPRMVGRSGYTPRQILQQTMSNAIGYSVLPLRILALLGLVGIGASVSLTVFYVVRFVSGGISAPGFATQILLTTTMFGFNFFAFGVLGEYVLRILQLSGDQPAYGIRREADNSSQDK